MYPQIQIISKGQYDPCSTTPQRDPLGEQDGVA